MKKNCVIVIFWLLCLLGAFSLKAAANDSTKILIADETTVSYSKSTAKIECSNGEIAEKILRRYEQLIKRYSVTWKSDRHGRYKEYAIVFNKEDCKIVVGWVKGNL